jgi:hypothetical protein
MSFLDKLFGREQSQPTPPPRQAPAMDPDEEAIARYRYMLRTAPPEDLEQAHAEAFARLTPEQRQTVLQEISSRVPEFERPRSDDPRDLARAATRAEVREPGFMERNFRGGGGMGMGMGGMMMGGLFSSLAGAFIGSAIAHQFFDNPSHAENFAAENNLPADQGAMDAGNYAYADAPAADAPGAEAYEQDPMGDPGGDFGGDLGGDFGDI